MPWKSLTMSADRPTSRRTRFPIICARLRMPLAWGVGALVIARLFVDLPWWADVLGSGLRSAGDGRR